MLKGIYKNNKLGVNNYFCPLSGDFTSSPAPEHELPPDVNGVRVFDAEEVGQLAIIPAVVETETKRLIRYQE